MHADRARADHQCLGDLRVGPAGRKQRQDLQLPVRETQLRGNHRRSGFAALNAGTEVYPRGIEQRQSRSRPPARCGEEPSTATGVRVFRVAAAAVGIHRRELLDRTLIWNQHHLLHVLREFEQFYKAIVRTRASPTPDPRTRCPHSSPIQTSPGERRWPGRTRPARPAAGRTDLVDRPGWAAARSGTSGIGQSGMPPTKD